jgi:hypothetical protein
MPARLFWWRGGNFGDELSRFLCERFTGRPVEYSPLAAAELVGVGSLLESHLAHRRHPMFGLPPFTGPDVLPIDVGAPVAEVLARIARCRYILSSSLHGLIVADALGIPNGWLWLDTGRERTAGLTAFKVQDYHSAFDTPPTPITLSGGERRDDILRRLVAPDRPGLEAIREQLRARFQEALPHRPRARRGRAGERSPAASLKTASGAAAGLPTPPSTGPLAAERPTVQAALDVIARRWPELPGEEAEPVFILAAGWRSGSTLLQRMLMPECFVWGEPYGHAGPIPALAETIRCFTDQWPEPHFFHRGEPTSKLEQRFIANLYPPVDALLAAHRAWFRELFAEPARQAGATRWGLKEVRLTVEHARYLRWLFPRAKFLFLHRNPYDAWRSYAARRDAGWRWFRDWPGEPLTAELFARHWRELVSGFRDGHADVGGLLVRFEDLAAGRTEAIEQYLGFPLSRSAAASNPSDGGPPPRPEISPTERAVLDAELGVLAEQMGYRRAEDPRPPSEGALPGQPGPLGGSVPTARCVVLVPANGPVDRECDAALKELEARGYTVRRVGGYAAADQGRCQMASSALRQGFDELMWIDRDVIFRADDVDRLRSHGLPVTCGLYAVPGRREFACEFRPETARVHLGSQGGLLEVASAGLGFMHTRREVYEAVRQGHDLPSCNRQFGEDLIPFFLPMVTEHDRSEHDRSEHDRSEQGGRPRYLTGDRAFCARLRACGFAIWADTTIRLWRNGPYGFGWEDAGGRLERFRDYTFHLRAE